MIIDTNFADRTKRRDPEYLRIIKEVRKSRRLGRNVRLQLSLGEAAFGTDIFTRRVLSAKGILFLSLGLRFPFRLRLWQLPLQQGLRPP